MITRLSLIFGVVLLAHSAVAATTPPPRPTPSPTPVPVTSSLVRVSSTNQPYDFFRPWLKKPPFNRRGLGVVTVGGNILVSAELVANHTFIELELPTTGEKCAAEVVHVDYDCNLALLKPTAPDFCKDATPIALDDTARVDDKVDIIQLEPTGTMASTPGTITTITVANYPSDHISLLTYRLSSPLQSREGSFTIPALHNGRLLGFVMRYDSRTQTADVIPAPVISHFLTDAAAAGYAGFPRVGVAYASARDPQLRHYLGLTEPGGVYVTYVRPSGAAEKAGLKKGDILLSVGGHAIDADGNYDDPAFGRLPFSHLVSTQAHVGDVVNFDIFRDGRRQSLPVTLESTDSEKSIVEPSVFDRAPRYFILGGLVFQELSRPYLQEWGPNWMKDAPQQLVALDIFQNELPADHGKVVFLSQVFPTANTVGYENLEHLVVKRVNGVEIKSLDDLAKAATHPQDGFQKIEFADDPPLIYLDAAEAEKSNEQIRHEYGIPELKNL